MAITSEDIQNQSFSIDRKGYDVDEVDVFLEHVAAEIDGLNAEIDALNAELDALAAQLDDMHAEVIEDEDGEMDMDAAFAEPALPAPSSEDLAAKDARIAELEKQLQQKMTDSSAIADALVTAQRSAKEVIASAQAKADRIIAEAEADAADIIDKANTEKETIEKDIDELDKTHDETCDMYAKSLREFIEDASKKLAGIENAKGVARAAGKKSNHGRYASPAQAPVHKPAPSKPMGAVSPSYTAPIAGVSAPVSVNPQAKGAAPAVSSPVSVKPSAVEKDLSGFGDANDGFDLGDVD